MADGVIFLLSILAIIACGLFYLKFLWYSFKAYNSKFWDVTEGKIIVAYIEETIDEDGYPDYIPKIKYEYIVDGKNYSSKRIAFRFVHNGVYKDFLTINKTVNVYYNPSNPADAVLKPGFSKEYKEVAFFAVLFPLIILLFNLLF